MICDIYTPLAGATGMLPQRKGKKLRKSEFVMSVVELLCQSRGEDQGMKQKKISIIDLVCLTLSEF